MVSPQDRSEKIEKVQKRATKMVPSCKGLSYMERLKVLGIPTLKYRRCRTDMIETFKILHGIYDTAVAPVLPICQESVTRGNSCRLVKNFSRYIAVKRFHYLLFCIALFNYRIIIASVLVVC